MKSYVKLLNVSDSKKNNVTVTKITHFWDFGDFFDFFKFF